MFTHKKYNDLPDINDNNGECDRSVAWIKLDYLKWHKLNRLTDADIINWWDTQRRNSANNVDRSDN